jgi:molybdopterin synthase sulfur carrier subunit
MADPVPGPESGERAITLAVKLFAGLREQAGWQERQICLPAGPPAPTPRRLWQVLQIGQPETSQGIAGDGELSSPALVDGALSPVAQPDRPWPDGPLPPSVRVAVNQSFAQGDQLLGDGDEVAFLPAISGG